MSLLNELSQFEAGIYQLERTDPVDAGTNGDGVSNLQAKQLANRTKYLKDHLDAVEDEINTARGGEANLDLRLDGIDSDISNLQSFSSLSGNIQLEYMAEAMKDRMPSAFDYTSFVPMAEISGVDTTTLRSNTKDWSLVVQALDEASTDMANKLGFVGSPKNVFVDGFKLNLDARPEFELSNVIELETAPVSGGRLDFVFLEVWKEKVIIGAADDVLFPNGAVDFEIDSLTEFDSCTLASANQTGGNFPAYMANATDHGSYIMANDVNVPSFLANPDNNVIKGDDNVYYQLRWRIRTTSGVTNELVAFPHDDSAIVAQGKLAAPSVITFSSVDGDAGLSVANDATLSKDSIVRAIPIALVHRRNSTAWTLVNPNGAGSLALTSIRPDGKFYNHIQLNDVCDLRNHGVIDNNFDFKAMYDKNLNEILSSNLQTVMEPMNSDSDGNLTYKDLGIYGTKLLRMDGLAGTIPFDASFEVINRLTAENGVSAKLDGIRNYYSDVGGEQVVTGIVSDISADGVTPTSVFTYVAASKTLTIDATDLESNDGVHASRTKISTRTPNLKWGRSSQALDSLGIQGNYPVRGTWTGLGGDSASFLIADKTSFTLYSTAAIADIEIGDTYTSSNGVVCTVISIHWPQNYITFDFTGTTLPSMAGLWNRTTGIGNATLNHQVTIGSEAVYLATTDLTAAGVRVNDTYTAPDAITYKISGVNKNLFQIHRISGGGAPPALGTWTKVTGDGPATFTSNVSLPHRMGTTGTSSTGTLLTGILGLGSNVMPTNSSLHVQAYLDFKPGSGILSRIPHQSNDSIKGCQFYVDGTQVLPNNGIGFTPFGSTVDPVNDGNLSIDSHSRTANLMGFAYKDTVMPLGAEPNGYNDNYSITPCVIKDGSTYKMWFGGSDGSNMRILYSTSTDCINWTTPVLAQDIGTAAGNINGGGCSTPCVIKDGSTYKMWFGGLSSDDNLYRILYSTSTDGITWTTPVLAMDVNTEPNGLNVGNSYYPSVIKDGSTYKMWFGAYKNPYVTTLYSTSTDGITWTTPVLVMSQNTDPSGYTYRSALSSCVIKEGSTYKMFLSGSAESYKYRIMYAVSKDGLNWSIPKLLKDVGSNLDGADATHCYIPYVIKDGSTYKIWYTTDNSTVYRKMYFAVLSMTDSANVGSSTTGVYATAGSLQLAPPANSQVVVLYEALADQLDRSLLGTFENTNTLFNNKDLVISSLGTGTIELPQSPYRDLITSIFPYTGLTYQRKGIEISFSPSTSRNALVNSTYKDEFDANKFFLGDVVITRVGVLSNEVASITSGYSSVGVSVLNSGTSPMVLNNSVDDVVSSYWGDSLKLGMCLHAYEKAIMLSIKTGGSDSSYFNGLSKKIRILGRPILK